VLAKDSIMNRQRIVLINELNGQKKFTILNREEKTFVIFLIDIKDYNGRILFDIQGSEAKIQVLGLIIAEEDQMINLFTLQDHKKKKSISDLLIKSVLFGSSRLNFEGLVRIRKDAQQSNAYQKNQTFLMSHHAWANSRPKLEILANDIRCTHGATIGKINPEVLYYLKARGISEESAKKIVIEGFFQEILNRIPDQKIADELLKKIKQKINNILLN